MTTMAEEFAKACENCGYLSHSESVDLALSIDANATLTTEPGGLIVIVFSDGSRMRINNLPPE